MAISVNHPQADGVLPYFLPLQLFATMCGNKNVANRFASASSEERYCLWKLRSLIRWNEYQLDAVLPCYTPSCDASPLPKVSDYTPPLVSLDKAGAYWHLSSGRRPLGAKLSLCTAQLVGAYIGKVESTLHLGLRGSPSTSSPAALPRYHIRIPITPLLLRPPNPT